MTVVGMTELEFQEHLDKCGSWVCSEKHPGSGRFCREIRETEVDDWASDWKRKTLDRINELVTGFGHVVSKDGAIVDGSRIGIAVSARRRGQLASYHRPQRKNQVKFRVVWKGPQRRQNRPLPDSFPLETMCDGVLQKIAAAISSDIRFIVARDKAQRDRAARVDISEQEVDDILELYPEHHGVLRRVLRPSDAPGMVELAGIDLSPEAAERVITALAAELPKAKE